MTASKLLLMAERLLRRYTLCDWCLGRQFAILGYGLSNQARGVAFKTLLLIAAAELYHQKPKQGLSRLQQLAKRGQFLPAHQFLEKEGITDMTPVEPCYICEGVMNRLTEAANAVIQALKGWEAASLLLGSKVPADMMEREEQLRGEFQIETGEPIKAELNREIGKLVTDQLDIPADFTSPDIVAVVNIPDFTTELQVTPIYIYGCYQKFIRGIPQTKWPCRECRGMGCSRCKGTGKMYPESVEEIIAPPLLEMLEGIAVKFHGAGREDIDARMLGEGRPFVIEILTPRYRTINLEEAMLRINEHAKNKIKVTKFRFANKEVVKRLKASAAASKKVYKALVQVEKPIRQEELLNLEKLPMPLEVRQQTPQRVLHRRADRLRKKRIYALQAALRDKTAFELTIHCQGGLYVKEFISGDEGRTAPSIAEILGKPAICEQLDVVGVTVSEEKLPW